MLKTMRVVVALNIVQYQGIDRALIWLGWRESLQLNIMRSDNLRLNTYEEEASPEPHGIEAFS
jgi:hypothetical protein